MSTSAPAVNSVTLVGHLTQDPVLRELSDGRAVCDMRLAVNDQPDQPPLFIDVATFGASAAACERYLAKGRQIAVTGRLIYREWQAPMARAAASTPSSDASASAPAPTASPSMAMAPTTPTTTSTSDNRPQARRLPP
jgi:single-stranded DNA-binding protein